MAAPSRRPAAQRTWINARIRNLYRRLHQLGHCHSVEAYDGDTLVGGLYGVSLGGAFFGESMFHRARDASKVALVHLVARLKAGGYQLLDTQFVTDHLKTFGATAVSRRQYHKLLEARPGAPGRLRRDAPRPADRRKRRDEAGRWRWLRSLVGWASRKGGEGKRRPCAAFPRVGTARRKFGDG